MMRTATLAAMATALGLPAAADDVPDPRYPSEEIVYLHPLPPTFGNAGAGHVRLVPEAATRRVARLDANEFYAYESAYIRALTDLVMRMPVDRAEPLARQAAWRAVVGMTAVVGTIRPVPD